MLRTFAAICCLFLALALAADSKGDVSKSQSDVEVVYLNIKSQIQARFATTLITSKVNNLGSAAKEVTFTAQLPDGAFISNFSMFIDDKIIYGDVKEKEEAKVAFEEAKSRGESAGHLAQKPRETNVFQISVNVAAHSKITFNITYQEILKRVHGVYKQIINLQPDQPVSQINIEMNVVERGEITNLKIPKFGPKVGEKTNKELLTEDEEKDVDIKSNITNKVSNVRVVFQPKQKNPTDIVAGQLVLLYDVKRDLTGGDIEVVDGYFVHFFAPEGLPKGNKHVVFILDKSGSMLGRKFEQLKDAMKVILNDLNPEDTFNIVFFSTDLEKWKPESVKATAENVKAAQLFVMDTEASGGTNIFDSLKEGLKILEASKATTLSSMILFLTDGEPTVGVTNGTAINEDITKLNTNHYIINSIAFGDDSDFLLLRKISSNNKGLAKKVYEDSDAAIQLTGFYDEIATPLLSEVKINYLNDTVDVNSIVQDDTHNYFNGGEVVVIGKMQNQSSSNTDVQATVTGKGKSGSVELKAASSTPWICPRWGWGCCPHPVERIVEGDIMIRTCCWGRDWDGDCHPTRMTTPRPEPLAANTLGGFIERMWAYQTIKKLLKQNELSETKGSEMDKRKNQALDLSLRYHFVTELTSMVVIQPNETEKSTLKENSGADDKKEKLNNFGGFAAGMPGRGSNRLLGPAAPLGALAANARGDFGSRSGGGGFEHAPLATQAPFPADEETGASFAPEPLPTTDVGKKEKKPEDSEDTCNLNVIMIAHATNESDRYAWYDDFSKNLIKDLHSSKNIQSLHSRVLKAEENKDDLTKLISEAFKQFKVQNATNVVIFFAYPDSMDYAKSAAAKLVKQGDRIYCVSSAKVSNSKKSELLALCGDFANLFISPASKVVSEKLGCKNLYVWRSNF